MAKIAGPRNAVVRRSIWNLELPVAGSFERLAGMSMRFFIAMAWRIRLPWIGPGMLTGFTSEGAAGEFVPDIHALNGALGLPARDADIVEPTVVQSMQT